MRWILLILLALGLTVWFLPLSLVAPRLVPELKADSISGSIWNGRIRNARYNGLLLGDLDVEADPYSLLSGEPGLRFSRLGNRRLEGRVSGNRRTQNVSGLSGDLELPLLPAPVPPIGVRLDNVIASIGPNGCKAAGGRVEASLPGLPFLGNAPRLSGTPACDGDAFIARLTSPNALVGVNLRAWKDGRWQASIVANSSHPLATAPLRQLGFVQGPDGLHISRQGGGPGAASAQSPHPRPLP